MSAKSVAELERELERDRLARLVLDDDRSCMPSPTKRSRAIESESCASPPASGLRRKKAAEKYSTLPDESSSGRSPLIVSSRRERKRVSSAKKPARRAADVAELVADAEGRALEDRERHDAASLPRMMRAPLDCASALTTISSTFTCGGRVTAKRTQSAMSSGVTRLDALVDGVAPSPRRPEADDREVGLDEPGVDGRERIGRPSRSSRSAYVKPRTANFEAKYERAVLVRLRARRSSRC